MAKNSQSNSVKSDIKGVKGGVVKNPKGMGTKGVNSDQAGDGIKGMEGTTTSVTTRADSKAKGAMTYNDHDADDQMVNTKNKGMY